MFITLGGGSEHHWGVYVFPLKDWEDKRSDAPFEIRMGNLYFKINKLLQFFVYFCNFLLGCQFLFALTPHYTGHAFFYIKQNN